MANENINLISDACYKNGFGLSGGDCAVGFDIFGFSSGSCDGALRFTNIAIPQGSTLSMAYIVYKYGTVGGSGSWKFNVEGIDEDNTASFGDPFGRSRTTASAGFNEGEPTSGGTKIIDVKSIVQEIVNRAGWSSGNAMGFIFDDQTSDSDVFAFADNTNSYLVYRISAEPNFTPTPTSVTAPSLPNAGDVGMRFSEPGVSVLTATDDQCHLTTRKNMVKLLDEDLYTSDAVEIVAIPHSLGYIPFVTVYAQEVGQDWRKIPRSNASNAIPFYFLDDDNLYLSSSEIGQKFYYRIFIDRIV